MIRRRLVHLMPGLLAGVILLSLPIGVGAEELGVAPGGESVLRQQRDEIDDLLARLETRRGEREAQVGTLKQEAEAALLALNNARREKHYLDADIDLTGYEETFSNARRAHAEARRALRNLELGLARLTRERTRVEARIQSQAVAKPAPPEAPSSREVSARTASAPPARSERGPGAQTRPVTRPRLETEARKPAAAHPQQRLAQSGATQRTKPDAATPESRGARLSVTPPSVTEAPRRTDDPRAGAWVRQSLAKVESGDWLEAVRAASLAISFDPGLSAPYINRAWAYTELGLLDEAARDCGVVLVIAPRDALARNNCGLVYQRRGEARRAQDAYEAACLLGTELGCTNYRQLTGRDFVTPRDGEALIDASYRAFQRGDWGGVERTASLALLLVPDNATALLNRAGARANQGDWARAMADVEAALRQAPDSGLAYNNKGFILEGQGKRAEADVFYSIACRQGSERGCRNHERLSSR